MSILSDYTEMVSEMAEWTERADKIELELEDTDAALEYSKEVLRIAGKLAEAAYWYVGEFNLWVILKQETAKC